MRDPAAGIIPAEAEAPCYDYENPGESRFPAFDCLCVGQLIVPPSSSCYSSAAFALCSPCLLFAEHESYNTAATLQQLFRTKTPPDVVLKNLSGFPLQPTNAPLTTLTRSIAVQTLLFIGARSFSHFLNATERYLPLLRGLATTDAERLDVLDSVGRFWRESGQMRVIIADKLMQYGVVGGEDVVRWVFSTQGGSGRVGKDGEEWMAGQKWDLLRMGVDKVNGRVVGVRRKIVALEAEEEERRGGRRAARPIGDLDIEGNGTAGMEMDTTVDGSVDGEYQLSLSLCVLALSLPPPFVELLQTDASLSPSSQTNPSPLPQRPPLPRPSWPSPPSSRPRSRSSSQPPPRLSRASSPTPPLPPRDSQRCSSKGDGTGGRSGPSRIGRPGVGGAGGESFVGW